MVEVRGRLQAQLDKPTENSLRKHTHAKHFFSALSAREKVGTPHVSRVQGSEFGWLLRAGCIPPICG